MFTPADPETWPRRDHFRYYREELPCGYSVTVRLDVTAFRRRVAALGLPFHDVFMWCVSECIRAVPEYRMGVDGEGRPGFYDVLHPVYTVLHEDHTFSDLWTCHEDDVHAFCRQVAADKAQYGQVRGHKGKPGMPPGFYCISCVPWLDFTGYSTTLTDGRPTSLFPVITYGKFTQSAGRWTLPFAINISHAAADGWHTARFVALLQEKLDGLGEEVASV